MTLNQITLPCLNYAATVAFYRTLGLTLIVDSPPRYARLESADGSGATLSLHAVETAPGPGTVIYFDHDSPAALDAHVSQLEARGFEFLSHPKDESWGWREARLLDPSGNEVCLMFAGTVRRFPDWRVDGRKA